MLRNYLEGADVSLPVGWKMEGEVEYDLRQLAGAGLSVADYISYVIASLAC